MTASILSNGKPWGAIELTVPIEQEETVVVVAICNKSGAIAQALRVEDPLRFKMVLDRLIPVGDRAVAIRLKRREPVT